MDENPGSRNPKNVPLPAAAVLLIAILQFGVSLLVEGGLTNTLPAHYVGALLQAALFVWLRKHWDKDQKLHLTKRQDLAGLPTFAFAGIALYFTLQASRYIFLPGTKGDDMDAGVFGPLIIVPNILLGFLSSLAAGPRRQDALRLNLLVLGVFATAVVLTLIITG